HSFARQQPRPPPFPYTTLFRSQLHDYLVGRRRTFDVPVDTALATGFRGEVQQHLASLDYGRTATYKELATQLGRPGAVRAVGTACATNPLPLIWPCHRVLRTDGGLGGERGGPEPQDRLLAMESAACRRGRSARWWGSGRSRWSRRVRTSSSSSSAPSPAADTGSRRRRGSSWGSRCGWWR